MNWFKKLLKRNITIPIQRGWSAGQSNRFLNDWVTGLTDINSDLKSDLPTIRTRTKDMVQNCPFFNKYLSLRQKNIFGNNGIGLQIKARDDNGKLDKRANQELEIAWKDFCKPQNLTVERNKSMLDLCTMLDATKETSGEFFIRIIKGFDNKYGLALQVIDPAKCDIDANKPAKMGGQPQTIMGIKLDQWGSPNAYIFKQTYDLNNYNYTPQKTVTYSSSEIIHGFNQNFPGQVRGYPKAASILFNLQMLKGYSEAEVMAARANACKMGFFTTPAGEDIKGMADDKSGEQYQINVEPMTFQKLPNGSEFKTFDTNNPNANYANFIQAQLREIASGLDIGYNSLHSNMESVNFSSLRSSAIEERDRWKIEQKWYIEHLLEPIFNIWLDMYLLSDMTKLPYSKKWKFNTPIWQPRTWQWVDPYKDAQANQMLMENYVIPPQDIIAETGRDAEDVLDQFEMWEQMKAERKGLVNNQVNKNEVNNG